MSKLSEILKQKREEKGLSLKDVSKSIKISVAYLEYIENSEWLKLPSYVHAHGFFKTYAQFLGLNYDELKPLFDEECKREDFDKRYVKVESDEIIQKEVNLKNIHKSVVVFSLLIIAFIAGVSYFLIKSKNKINNSDNQVNIPPVAVVKKKDNKTDAKVDNDTKDNVSENKTVEEEEISPQEIVKKIKEEEKVEKPKKHKVELLFNDVCWVNIKIDNETVLDFIAKPGTKRVIEFSKFFYIDIGNAAALTIKYNNITFNRFGRYRQPVKNLYFTVNEDNFLMYEKVK